MDSPRPQPGPSSAVSFFIVVLTLQLVVGIPAQLLGIGSGLIFTELFVFLWPSILWTHRLGAKAVDFVRAGPPPRRLVGLGLVIGAVNYPIAMALEAAMHRLLPDLAKLYDTGAILSRVTGPGRIALALGIGLLAPLGEEFAFRGVIQRLFRTRWSAARSVLITAILFSLIHLDPVGFPGRVELGMLFGALALWSGSIWTGMAAHAGNNLLALVLFYGVGGRADDELPGIAQLVGMLAVGAVLVAPLLVLFRRLSAGLEASELPPLVPRRVEVGVMAWVGAMIAVLGGMIAWDPLSFRLGLTDATTPYQQGFADGAPHQALDAELRALHDQAATKQIPLQAYVALRKWLFVQAQAKTLSVVEVEKRIAVLTAKRAPP